MSREHPGCPKDGRLPPGIDHAIFARKLGGAIDPKRCGRRILGPWGVAAAVEDIVGRDMQQRHAKTGRRTRNRSGRQCVDQMRGLGLGLGAIHRGIGGSVDHKARGGRTQRLRAGIRIGQIGVIAAQENGPWRTFCQFPRDLPGPAKDQQSLHHAVPSRRPTPSRDSSGCHQSRLSRYQATVRRSPSSTVTDGRQPSSSRIRVGSIA